jgi:hypothetical protein
VEDIIANAMNDLKAEPQTSSEQCFLSGKVSGRGALLCKGTDLKGIYSISYKRKILFIDKFWEPFEHTSYII